MGIGSILHDEFVQDWTSTSTQDEQITQEEPINQNKLETLNQMSKIK
jgi:hypothetical protein